MTKNRLQLKIQVLRNIDKIFEKVNQDYKKHRITEAEFYNIQINALIWKELRKITKILENKE